MKKLLVTAAVLLLVVLVFFVCGTWYASSGLISYRYSAGQEVFDRRLGAFSKRHGVRVEKTVFNTYEKSDTGSGKKIELRGWLVPGPDAQAPLFIVLHGRGASRLSTLKWMSMFHDAGYLVLAYDQRCHGLSGGDYSTGGYYESYDVSSAIDYVQGRSDLNPRSIGVLGASMGGAAAIMAASRDKRIDVLVDDSAFAHLPAFYADYIERKSSSFHKMIFTRPATWLSEYRADFRLSDVSPVTAVKRVRIPTLIIHCMEDAVTRASASKLIHRASGAQRKKLKLFKNCAHCGAINRHPREYVSLVLDFVNRVISGNQ